MKKNKLPRKKKKVHKLVKKYIKDNGYILYPINFNPPMVDVHRPSIRLNCRIEISDLESNYIGEDNLNEFILDKMAYAFSINKDFLSQIHIESEREYQPMYQSAKTIYYGDIEILTKY